MNLFALCLKNPSSLEVQGKIREKEPKSQRVKQSSVLKFDKMKENYL